MIALRLGKIPTASVRRRISLFNRSAGLFDQVWRDRAARDRPRTAMEILGHSTLEMTMNTYAHVSLADKRAALNRVNDLFEGESD